jgi:hypothetical protein
LGILVVVVVIAVVITPTIAKLITTTTPIIIVPILLTCGGDCVAELCDALESAEEPVVDGRQLVDLLHRHRTLQQHLTDTTSGQAPHSVKGAGEGSPHPDHSRGWVTVGRSPAVGSVGPGMK